MLCWRDFFLFIWDWSLWHLSDKKNLSSLSKSSKLFYLGCSC